MQGIEYPAQKWTPQYDAERDRGGILSQGFKSFFEKNFSTFFKWHVKKLAKLQSVEEAAD